MSWTITSAIKSIEGIPWRQIPASKKWTPASITTALWLDAADSSTIFTTSAGSTQTLDGGVVGRWVDKSGNTQNATITTDSFRPTLQNTGLNTYESLYFNGANELLLPTGFLNGATAFTMAMVMRGPMQLNDAIFGPSNDSVKGLELVWTNTVSYPTLCRINGVNKFTSGLWSTTNVPTITTITASAASTAGWLNGSTVSATSSTGISGLNFNGIYSLGTYASSVNVGNATGGNVRSEMNMAEFIILTSSASQSDREKLEGYLAHKWELTANLPNNHPYKTVAPTP